MSTSANDETPGQADLRDSETLARNSHPPPTTRPSRPLALAPSLGRRYARSRDGCLTCKRRKVKCDEQRPRCSHCERLNMECKWRVQSRAIASRERVGGFTLEPEHAYSPVTDLSSTASSLPVSGAVGDIFDYASFTWTDGDYWQQVGPDFGQNVNLNANVLMGLESDGTPLEQQFDASSDPQVVDLDAGVSGSFDSRSFSGSERLLEFFTTSAIPPILAEVESQKKWSAMRQGLLEMAQDSRMVYCSILAFSHVILSRKDQAWAAAEQKHYETALAEVRRSDSVSPTQQPPQRQQLLAALFLLSYVDILENRIGAAHSNLKRAHAIFQDGNKNSFSQLERQLLLWFRLVDGRAVSAGGDGLFLSKEGDLALVEASPASFDGDFDSTPKHASADGDVEDVLFQVLYQPGIVFFQRVQSFMGRIAKIDPWHRSRGTVEDETEVMNIGASISADLRTLYDQRPPLMDYAIAGKLVQPHISAHLAFVLCRAFRTYLSNYYACKVHLHRVAYKSLPLTREASDALEMIRKLARQIAAETDPEDALPVNMLWPLLMLGVEEEDPQERLWIKAQMTGMEKVAGNAKITSQVLEEVHARQDKAKMRVDIRSVMHAVFNSCFAII